MGYGVFWIVLVATSAKTATGFLDEEVVTVNGTDWEWQSAVPHHAW